MDVFFTWATEFKEIFRDKGVLVLFVLAPFAYPVLYGTIYKNEVLRDVPIAVVDLSSSQWSRKYIRAIDATPDVKVAAHSLSVEEARQLYLHRKVHGILVIPEEFQHKLNRNEQATVAGYADMSSFLYYKALMMAVSYVSRDLGLEIQLSRVMADGQTYQRALVAAAPFTYSHTALFNPTGGYASFLLPAVFILIIHQTLLMGIGMLAGAAYERNPFLYLNRVGDVRQSVFGLLIGKSLAYLVFYGVVCFYIIGLVVPWFNLPHIGDFVTLLLFFLPFLLATIFFSMTLAVFLKEQEHSMLLFLFLSVPLLFVSGVSWPVDGMPRFWKVVGWLFPSTHGITGYVKINTMGAKLNGVEWEYFSLWILTGFYFCTAYLARIIQLKRLQAEMERQ